MEPLLSIDVGNGANGEKRIKHYNSNQKILLVGEGDFSFAKCLATAFGSATNLVATSLDSEDELIRKYPNAMDNVKELKERGSTVIHQVDASTMHNHPALTHQRFNRIVFNFPHAGFIWPWPEHSTYQIELHKAVVKKFFRSASMMVAIHGEVHITHKMAHPFEKWEIEKLAAEEGLGLIEKAWFSLGDYPGYTNRKGSGPTSSATFPVGLCYTFKFAKANSSLF